MKVDGWIMMKCVLRRAVVVEGVKLCVCLSPGKALRLSFPTIQCRLSALQKLVNIERK
jgi:hypothetical protein